MAANLKEIMQEVVDALSICPEEFKAQAFDILLRHRLQAAGGSAGTTREAPRASEPPAAATPIDEHLPAPEGEEEIALKDLHARARKFLQDHSLDISHVNALYYKDGGRITPLYDDLRSTAMAESQLRLGLLEAFEVSMASGTFEFNGESIREKCKIHKCYDGPNFTRNFKSNQALFEDFEAYDAGAPIRLSPAGKQRLASVIQDLARTA